MTWTGCKSAGLDRSAAPPQARILGEQATETTIGVIPRPDHPFVAPNRRNEADSAADVRKSTSINQRGQPRKLRAGLTRETCG